MAGPSADGGGVRPVTVEELIALNEEITALVRAGSPLEAGLGRAAADLPGRPGGVAMRLADRMRRGSTLVEALEAERATIPPLYRAVVEAGSRSGDLSTALAGVSGYLRGFVEARQAVGLALWYPLIVATVAYGLFLGLVIVFAPRLAVAFSTLGLPVAFGMRALERLHETVWIWWPIGPLALVAMGIGWHRSGRAAQFNGKAWSFLGLFPWVGPLVRDYRSAGFAELLALLLENRVPYPRAVVLAAEATGDARFLADSRAAAVELERGTSASEAAAGGAFRAFPPLLRWVLTHGAAEGSVSQTLRNLAPMYRTRASASAMKLRVLLPSLIVMTVGASATFLYAMTLFLPLTGLLRELAGP